MKSRPRTLNWPHQIVRGERRAVNTGHGSFNLRHVHVEANAWDRQRVRLSTNLLVFVEHGGAILEHGDTRLLLHAGDGALVPPGEFRLTELTARPFSSGEVRLFFFNDRALAEVLAHRDGLGEFVAHVSMPPLPFYPVRSLGVVLRGAMDTQGTLVPAHDFRRIFSCALQTVGAPIAAFLKHRYFMRRFRLCQFLEDHCLPKVNALAVEALYPGGLLAFRRECVIYLDMPLEQWLFRRRLELAHHWLRCSSRPVHEIASRLGYGHLRRFRGDVRRYVGFAVDDLVILRHLSSCEDRLEEVCLPFWFPSREARAAKERLREADALWLRVMRNEHGDLKRWSRRYIQDEGSPVVEATAPLFPNPAPAEASVENFLRLHTTKVSNRIRFEPAETCGDRGTEGRTPMAMAA